MTQAHDELASVTNERQSLHPRIILEFLDLLAAFYVKDANDAVIAPGRIQPTVLRKRRGVNVGKRTFGLADASRGETFPASWRSAEISVGRTDLATGTPRHSTDVEKPPDLEQTSIDICVINHLLRSLVQPGLDADKSRLPEIEYWWLSRDRDPAPCPRHDRGFVLDLYERVDDLNVGFWRLIGGLGSNDVDHLHFPQVDRPMARLVPYLAQTLNGSDD